MVLILFKPQTPDQIKNLVSWCFMSISEPWCSNFMPKVSVCLLRNACFCVWGTYNFMKKCRQTWKCGQKTEKQRRASAAQLGWDNVGNNSCGTLLGEYDDIITPVEHQHNCLYHTPPPYSPYRVFKKCSHSLPPPYSPWLQGTQQNGVILYIHHTHHGYRVFDKMVSFFKLVPSILPFLENTQCLGWLEYFSSNIDFYWLYKLSLIFYHLLERCKWECNFNVGFTIFVLLIFQLFFQFGYFTWVKQGQFWVFLSFSFLGIQFIL